MKKEMSAIIHMPGNGVFQSRKTRATRVIVLAFKAIPLPLRRMLFRGLFRLFYHISSRQRMIALHNLKNSYPEKSIWELKRIALGVYRNIALTMADFFEIPFIDAGNLHKWVEFEGLENLERAKAQGKGVLSIVAHFGNWELMTAAIPLASGPMYIIYRPLDSPVLEDVVAWMRTHKGNFLIPKEGATKVVRRLLKEGKVMGILNDQNVSAGEGVFVDFFNRPACTSPGTAYMALRTGASVVAGYLFRKDDGKYKFVIEPVEVISTGNFEQDLIANTQKFTDVVESIVRKYPDQWFWIHQRWKTKLNQVEP
ncbi:MAG: lysophospholipid acyltransferase family protein [Syntrophaceae bacterium]